MRDEQCDRVARPKPVDNLLKEVDISEADMDNLTSESDKLWKCLQDNIQERRDSDHSCALNSLHAQTMMIELALLYLRARSRPPENGVVNS